MKNIRIFLASSSTLEHERDEIVLFLAAKNHYLTKHNIFLELIRWEFLSSSFSPTRKQDDFNQELLTTDIFLCLIHDRIGQYTREEFETAFRYHQSGLRIQKLYLYFKSLPKGKEMLYPEVETFRKDIEAKGQCYRYYKNVDQLKVLLNQNLEADLPVLLQQNILDTIEKGFPEKKINSLPEEVETELDEADQMLDRNLTREGLHLYQKVLPTVSKTTQSLLWSQLKRKIGRCYLRLGSWEESEENRQKALICFEEALKNLHPDQHRKEYLQTLHDMGEIKADISYHRDSKENLKTALSYVQQQLALAPRDEYPDENQDALECLGQIKSLLAQFERPKENLTEALEYLTSALTYYHPETNLNAYITILYFISSCYWRLSQIENQQENLDKALHFAEKGLPLVSVENQPRLSRLIHNMLEVIYSHLGKMNKNASQLEKALEHNEICLSTRSKNKLSAFDITSLLNKGTMLLNLYEITSEKKILLSSLKALKQVLQQTDMKTYPRYYALINQSLSRAYLAEAKLPSLPLSNKRDILSQALKSIRTSVAIFQKNAYPKDFSNCKTIEGDIFLEWISIENPTENRQAALSSYQEALSVFQEKLFQANHEELLSKIEHLSKTIEKPNHL